jgi:nucleoside-diphosphate-sugar epimerase
VPANVPPTTVIVHAAAITADPGEPGWPRAAHVAANTRPLLTVLEHAARTRPAAFVFLSSTGVFAAGDGGAAADGRAALRDSDEPSNRSPYAAAKRAGEILVPAALDGVADAHVVRLGHVYGPNEVARPSRLRVSLVAEWLAAARAGRPLSVRTDDPARDWTFAPDLAPALARVAAGGSAGRPLHLGSPHVKTDRALAALVARRFPGTSLSVQPAPTPLKAPMAPSDIPALRGFVWTDLDAGVAALLATAGATA